MVDVPQKYVIGQTHLKRHFINRKDSPPTNIIAIEIKKRLNL